MVHGCAPTVQGTARRIGVRRTRGGDGHESDTSRARIPHERPEIRSRRRGFDARWSSGRGGVRESWVSLDCCGRGGVPKPGSHGPAAPAVPAAVFCRAHQTRRVWFIVPNATRRSSRWTTSSSTTPSHGSGSSERRSDSTSSSARTAGTRSGAGSRAPVAAAAVPRARTDNKAFVSATGTVLYGSLSGVRRDARPTGGRRVR